MGISAVDLKTHPLSGISLIEASAGTGKTWTITHLYVRCLLETDYEVNQILVVTFTNAATQELKGRIRLLIYQVWCYLDNPQHDKPQFDTLYGEYRQQRDALFRLQKALVNFDEAAIYSIHGFCQRLLNSFPVETHSLLQQQIIPDENEIELAAIRDYWRRHIVNESLEKLRWMRAIWKLPDQLLNDVHPLLSFKKRLQQMAEEMDAESSLQDMQKHWKQLCENWVSQGGQIKEILQDNPALSKGKLRPATLGVLLKQLDDLFTHTVPYALPTRWELITTTKLLTCLNKNKQDERLTHSFFKQAEAFLALHAQWISNQKIVILIDAARYVQRSVNETKSTAQNISFNDLIMRVSAVLKPENHSLIKEINEAYPMAMVDEFQDTDNRQYQIFKALYKNQEHKTLILIGDPKQAIYSFRGADVFTYQQAKQVTERHFTLDTNYRSTSVYIDLVNQLFKQNSNAFIFNQLIDFHPVKADKDNQKQLTENNEPVLPLVSWIHPFTERPIAKGQASDYFAGVCANEIQRILQQGTLKLDAVTVQARDLTILVKTGRQASLMKNRLAQLGISSALILRDSVFASDQSREISLLLEVLIEPSNISRLNGLLSSDLFGWNAAEIYRLQRNNQQLVMLLEQIKSYQQHWREKGILSMFFKLLGDQQSLQKNIRYMEGERRVTNWLHIMELLQQQTSQHASQSQALHWLLQQRERIDSNNINEEHQLRLESDSDLVRIVTIHKSKGLEYPIIFLPFMWDIKDRRKAPVTYSYHDDDGNKRIMINDESEQQRWQQENLAEEIRLFYVAMTRAKYRCYLAWGNISGAGGSAIAHCLYRDQIKQGRFGLDLDVSDAEQLRRPFDALNLSQPRVDIVGAEGIQAKESKQVSPQIEQAPAKSFSRRIKQQWRISSYSQIAATGFIDEVDRPDYDGVVNQPIAFETVEDRGLLNRFTFPKGARAGNFLHELLEHQPFDRAIDKDMIKQTCQLYGYDEQWIPCLSEWLNEILQCKLGKFQLSELKPTQKICEMEFYMLSKNLKPDALNALLHQSRYSRPEQLFSFTDVKGFIKGFIDLVFEHQGQYFIADYKSNYLGPSVDYYDIDSCEQAMFEHHYHLQYLIYTLALHRFLQQRLVDYDYDKHVGGVYYLFLRGMSITGTGHQGVYFHKPGRDVIEQLNRLFEQ